MSRIELALRLIDVVSPDHINIGRSHSRTSKPDAREKLKSAKPPSPSQRNTPQIKTQIIFRFILAATRTHPHEGGQSPRKRRKEPENEGIGDTSLAPCDILNDAVDNLVRNDAENRAIAEWYRRTP